MVERGSGTIFHVASTAAFQPVPYFSVYSATKAYVVQLCESIDYELRPRGVRVLAFCPGPTLTEFSSEAGVPDAMVDRNKRFMLSAEAVADSAIRAIRGRRETRIPGILNNLAYVGTRLSPRALARWTSGFFFRPPGA